MAMTVENSLLRDRAFRLYDDDDDEYQHKLANPVR